MSPYPGKMNPFWRAYCSNGLVQPPPRKGIDNSTKWSLGVFLLVCHQPHPPISAESLQPKKVKEESVWSREWLKVTKKNDPEMSQFACKKGTQQLFRGFVGDEILLSYMGIIINHYGDLGGGNSNMFYFHPDPWGDDPIWLAYFSHGLKQTTN